MWLKALFLFQKFFSFRGWKKKILDYFMIANGKECD